MKTQPRDAGFTLIELLVATAIAAVVISMTFAANMLVASSVGELTASMEKGQAIDQGILAITAQLGSMYPIAEDSSAGREITGAGETPFIFANKPSADGVILSFVSTSALLGHDVQGPVQVRYIFEPYRSKLIVSETPFINDDQKTTDRWGVSQTLLEDVAEVSAEFFDGYQWHKSWTMPGNALPRAVKLSLKINGRHGREIEQEIVATIVCSTLKPRQSIIESRADNEM